MKRSKYFRLFAAMVSVLMLFSLLAGCQNGKKFDSSEAMISEMTGTYAGSNEHSGERIIIDGSHVIKFNINDVFPEIVDDSFFWENFPNENWAVFNLAKLLGKPYVEITTEPISTNVKESTISGMFVNKDGSLVSPEGYTLTKVSSDCVYPSAEMEEKFSEYNTYLQEQEKSIIAASAQSNLSEKQQSMDSALKSAQSGSGSKKSTASAETIAQCAFESMEDHLKYPRSATLDAWSKQPQYDDYGRVAICITVTAQNLYGNYITEDIYVVLQSCSIVGTYTYKRGGIHFVKNADLVSYLLVLNDFNIDPSTDYTKEGLYKEAIQLLKDKKYTLVMGKLNALGDYKSSAKLKEACVNLLNAEKYKNAIDLFSQGKYSAASKELSSLLENNRSGYLKAERALTLCNAAIRNNSGNNGNTSSGGNTAPTTPPATTPTQPVTAAPIPTPTQAPTQAPTQKPTQAPTQAPCSHTYKDATCTAPKTCTKCGATSGSALPHTWKAATCTEPETCTVCGATSGNAIGHMWKDATCAAPATCSVCGITTGDVVAHTWKDATCTTPATCTTCNKISGKAKGHIMDATVCENCSYTDFSAFARRFSDSDIGTWDHLIEAGYAPTNVSLSKDGVFTFTCLGETYYITLKQTYSDHYAGSADFEFSCYQNGVLLTDAEARMCVFEADFGLNETPEFVLHLSWDYFEGEYLYFSVEGTLDSLPYTP